jgi:hypothetical protein
MPRNYDDIDLAWTLNGDLAIGKDGDIADTSHDVLKSLRQEIRTRVRSSLEDWEMHPEIGADLDEIIGESNNKTTAEKGKNRIIDSLVRGNFMSEGDIKVKYVPVDQNRLLYILTVSVAPTAENDGSEEFTVKFLFHIRDRGFQFI